MKKVLFLLLYFFMSLTLLASQCPKCSFKNEEGDRYCLNCGNETRAITKEEVKQLEQEDKERKVYIQRSVEQNNKSDTEIHFYVRYDYKILKVFHHKLDIAITFRNESNFDVTVLSADVVATYGSNWKGSDNFNLLEPYDRPLKPGKSRTKVIKLWGDGSAYSLAVQFKDNIRVDIKTTSYS